jgi:cobalt/nickel transport system permease protein
MLDPTYIDSYSGVDALYQRLDARGKILVTLAFVVIMAVSVDDRPLRVMPFFLFVLALALMSRMPPAVLLRRTLPALPFFLFASLVLGFSKGSEAAVAAFLKAFLSVLSVIILVSTTRFSSLLKGLEGLKMPQILVSMISFVYRYLFIIADEYGHIKIARESRNFGGSKRWQWRAIGHSVGTLFLHSYERGERVYSAMVARGYDGNIRSLNTLKIGKRDLLFAISSIAYLLATWGLLV